MDKTQYNLCCEVLRRLDREEILGNVILIGSWCLLAYKDYFKNESYHPGIRTRDIDFLIPIPPRFAHKVDVASLLKDLDFVTSFKGRDGYMQFAHSDLMIEFIVPERGRGSDKPFSVPDLGLNAQPLRFMDFLAQNVISLKFADLTVLVPHPVNFALHKVIVSARRQKEVKQENDMRQAVELFKALIDNGEQTVIRQVFLSCPNKWQKTIINLLQDQPLSEKIVALLKND